MEQGLCSFPALAFGGRVERGIAGIARGRAAAAREGRDTQCRHYRLAIGQDHLRRGQRGFDAGKKIKGRKRHIAVDSLGLLLAVVVHSAGIQDRIGARAILIRLFVAFARIQTVFVDGGYTGKLLDWGKAMFGWLIQVVKRTEARTFKVLPKRWIVERSFAWLNHSRRLAKDHEILPHTAETMIQIAFIHLLLRRIK